MNRQHTPVGQLPEASTPEAACRAADDVVAIRARLVEINAETLERVRRAGLPE